MPAEPLTSPKVRKVNSNISDVSRTEGAAGSPGVALIGSVITDEKASLKVVQLSV